MKNIDKNNNIEPDENSFEWLSDDEIAKKFEEQMDKLKKIAKKEARENDEDPEKILDKIDDFFENWKEELEKIDTKKEKKAIKKYKKILNRGIDVQKEIINSWEFVLGEIKNWEKEKNPVAKSLLRIIKWILNTEK